MNQTDNPVFIVGAPRSGTTLLRSIIDAHPNICCPTWETGVFICFDALLKNTNQERGEEFNFCSLDRQNVIGWIRGSIEELMNQFLRRAQKQRWGEKTPAHVFHIDLIHEVFPRAQFVHIIRNGWDVVRSLQSMPFGTQSIRWSTSRWLDSVNAGRSAGLKMGSALYHEVRYEDLTAESEQTIVEICKFLGETAHPNMLAFHQAENNSWGLQQPALQSRPLSKHRKLGIHERAFFGWKASNLLRELQYTARGRD